MRRPEELPGHIGARFSVRDALRAGVSPERLRRDDLARPFPGVRIRLPAEPSTTGGGATDSPPRDLYARQTGERLSRIRAYAPRLGPGQFLSHESAAALWGAPLPLVLRDGVPVDGGTLPVHVSTFGTASLVRTSGVRAHRARIETTAVHMLDGVRVSSPASTWASLGTLPLVDLVALGDHLCRVWRRRPGRPQPDRPALTTVEELRHVIASGRRVGVGRLREAVELVREDSWSPRESALRCRIVLAGLPEPELNHDVYDASGRFLACVDLAYPSRRIAVEYHGVVHHSSYAQDVERIARLRAAGWIVIEVTASLFAADDELIRRIRSALRTG
ncbi:MULTISPECIES: hypothetical protein [Bacteria]|uniref:hypothetical protein n=1 Tax=Bacteria TaxID=2 RepID=UPI003C7B00B5